MLPHAILAIRMSQRPILVAGCSVLAVVILPVVLLALTLRQPVHAIDDLVAIQTVDGAIARMKTAALNGEAVDWVRARSSAMEIFERSRTRESLDAAMDALVQSLRDGHSLYLRAEQFQALRKHASGSQSGRLAEIDEAQAAIPIVSVFTFTALDALRGATQAAEISERLRRLRAGRACGAIVDLRRNEGGNMWPMLSGLSPLLPRGTLFYFVDRAERRRTVATEVRSIRLDGQEVVALTDDQADAPMPTAILIGERTASSGEIVAIALRANPNSVLIGSRTAGLTTGNELFELGNGGAVGISTTRLMTGNGESVSGPLKPEIEVGSSSFSDAALRAAQDWLRQSCPSPAPVV